MSFVLQDIEIDKALSHLGRLFLVAMAKPMDPEKIADFLGEIRDEAPAEVQHVFLTLEDLWERKLWHQLTETLLEYYATPESESQRLPMYNTFILSFADKINQLKLVRLGLSASQKLQGEDLTPAMLKNWR